MNAERPAVRGAKAVVSTRENLAVQRNLLASERTLLAYVRTALVFAVAGIALTQFFGTLVLDVLGWVFVCVGVFTLALGGLKFLRVKRRIRQFATGRSEE